MFYIAYPLSLFEFWEDLAAAEAKFIPNPNLLDDETENEALPLVRLVNYSFFEILLNTGRINEL